jgi:multidrug efflux pump subunit AcrB
VPIVAGTLWSEDPAIGAYELSRVAHAIEAELQRVPGTRDIDTLGSPDRVVHVLLDPQRLAGHDIDISNLRQALLAANASSDAGRAVADNHEIQLQAGTFLVSADEVADLVVGLNRGAPVFLRDVADIRYGADTPARYVQFGTGPAASDKGLAAIARLLLLLALLLLIGGSLGTAGMQWVVMKMLPFDNKSEFQVLVDMPEGTPLENTNRVLNALADHLGTVPEVTDYQTYAGTASLINFNGLVRQYYLRSAPYQGDIQVNLVDKHLRQRQSHDIARALRAPLQDIGRALGANVKIVEVPPGPPVLAPLVAEIYGLDYRGQIDAALAVRQVMQATTDIVDVDDFIEAPQRKLIVAVDRQRASHLGVSQRSVVDALSAALHGEDASHVHSENSKYPIPIRLEFSEGNKADIDALGALRVRSASGALVPIGEITDVRWSSREQTRYHKDLLPVMFVTGDMAGPLDSPLYGMAEVSSQLAERPILGTAPLQQFFTGQPDNPYAWSLKWDGEWQITFETFRDMGLAYSVGLILIYLLVVAQFRSYSLPLIIMAPIPLTLIGILPGHALLDKQFTATSMIGMIALAGIIVRNSILLVDFIQQQLHDGKPLEQAVVDATLIRARPILLTAVAAMLGAFFILDDPIFSGLSVSLIFGMLVSTLLTLLVIPVLYYAYHYKAEDARPNPHT